MTHDRRRDVVQGLLALLALGALLVGPPILLVSQVGWPLPTTEPSWDEVQTALTIGIQDQVIVKAVAVVAWLAWLQVCVCLGLEVVGAVRGRVQHGRFVVHGVRAAVGRLVASATLAVSSLGPSSALGMVGVAALPAVELVGAPAPPFPAHIGAVSPDVPPAPDETREAPPNYRTVTAERHDSFWAIAERALGNGLRWREVRDLNAGRTMPDGTTVTSMTDQVLSGWSLLVPADDAASGPPGPADPAPPAAPTDAAPPNEVTVQAGDNMWSLAEQHLAASVQRPVSAAEVAPVWLRFIDANRSRLVHPDNPSLIYPGQTFLLPSPTGEPAPVEAAPVAVAPAPVEPPAAETEPECEPVPSSTSSTSAVADDRQPAEPAAEAEQADPPVDAAALPEEADDDDGRGGAGAAVAMAGAVGTALAAGVVQAVRARRRRRRHQGGQSGPSRNGAERQLHQEVVAAADTDSVDHLHAALQQLAAEVASAGLACRPRIVQHGSEHIDVLLDRATTPAVAGWSAEASGLIWAHEVAAITTDATGRSEGSAATPLLISLGRPDDGSQLYLDLEAAGVVTLSGDHDVAVGIARGVVAELAHSPLAEAVQVVVVGGLGASVGALDRVTVVESWDDVAADVVAWARQSREALDGNGWANPFTARGAGARHEALVPLVVVATQPPDEDILGAVLAAGPSAVALVVADAEPVAGSTVVDCSSDELHVLGLDLTCRPQPVTVEVLEALVDLLDHADSSPEVPAELFPDELAVGSEEALDAEPYEDPPVDVLVRVLGDVTVDGPNEALTAKQAAVVAYVALHGTVTADALEDAVWATSATGSHRKRLANTISDCRRLLGPDLLPVAVDGRYSAGPELVTDAELFERRVRAAAGQPAEVAAEILQGALDLVGGKVFSYRSADRASFAWVDVENWVSLWEPKVTGVAQHLAELYLDLGAPHRAVEVARRVLRVVPTDTGVTESLMRAHAASGDHMSVKRVYEAHVNALDQLDLDEPAESTTKLYEELRRGGGSPAGS